MSNGKSVANISVAMTFRRKDGEEQTQWHRVTLYDKLADIAGQYLRKGRQVYVEGRLNYNTYTDKDGTEKTTTEIIASELQMLGPKEADSPAPVREPARKPTTPDEEIPF
jgi:single-strand DNA-binding protein